MNHTAICSPVKARRAFFAGLAAMVLIAGCASNPSDSRAKQGAKSGAAFGAGIGLLLGVLSGDSDTAARAVAVGATYGAAGGAYEGWRQDQDDERTRQITAAIRESKEQPAGLDDEARQREQLTRFLGVWQMEGWFEGADGERTRVSAQVNGDVHMGYFVEMAWIDLNVEGMDSQAWGTTTLGFTAADGYEMSTRFNTLADSIDLDGGRFDSGNRAFTWSDSTATTTIRFATPDRFSIETRAGGQAVESYTFTRS